MKYDKEMIEAIKNHGYSMEEWETLSEKQHLTLIINWFDLPDMDIINESKKYKNMKKNVKRINENIIESHVNMILGSVGLVLYQDTDGIYMVSLSNYEGNSVVAFSREDYQDFKKWYSPEGYKVVMATPQQKAAYDAVSSEIDSLMDNGGLYESKKYNKMKKSIKRINESQLRSIVSEAVKDTLNKVGTKPKGYEDDDEEEKHDSSRFFTPGASRAPHTTGGWGLSDRSEMYSESKRNNINKIVAESVRKVIKEMFMMNQGNGSDMMKIGGDNHTVIWAPLTPDAAKKLTSGSRNCCFSMNGGERYFNHYANSEQAIFIVKSNEDDRYSFIIGMDRNGKNIKAYDFNDKVIDRNHMMHGAVVMAVKMIKPKVAEVCDAFAERQGNDESQM